MPQHVFALTGGIGSGKSTVAKRFRERGLPVVDADQLAREAVAPGSPALDAIRRTFGETVIQADGALDRAALGRVVFADEAARATLNGIVHPRVRELAEQRFTALLGAGEPLVCYEIPLLFETGQEDRFRPVVVVRASEATQLERASRRDGADPDAIRARIAAQSPLWDKAARADHVIDNDGSLAETRRQADAVLDTICHSRGVDPSRYPR